MDEDRRMGRRQKFTVGEHVQVYCEHVSNGVRQTAWIRGIVTSADHRMVEVECGGEVYDTLGQRRFDRRLWCTHGSRRLRRAEADTDGFDTATSTVPPTDMP